VILGNTMINKVNQVAKTIAMLAPTLTPIKQTVYLAFRVNTKNKTVNQVAKTIAMLAPTLTPIKPTV
jgi:hypothetical protein